jgi:hypothetical protein
MKKRQKADIRSHGFMALIQRLHRPYASMNWIRFNGSLRAVAVSQPLAGTPLVNTEIRLRGACFVNPARSRLSEPLVFSRFKSCTVNLTV